MSEQDVVYAGGGNTRDVLLLCKAWGVDRALLAANAGGTELRENVTKVPEKRAFRLVAGMRGVRERALPTRLISALSE